MTSYMNLSRLRLESVDGRIYSYWNPVSRSYLYYVMHPYGSTYPISQVSVYFLLNKGMVLEQLKRTEVRNGLRCYAERHRLYAQERVR